MNPHAPSRPIELRKAAESKVLRTHFSPSESRGDLLRVQHELRVHQIELEMQNEELRNAQEEIEAGLQRYTELYDFAPSGFFNLDKKGDIRLVNLAGAKLAGLSRSELMGKRFSTLLSPSCRKPFADNQDKVYATGETQSFETLLLTHGREPRSIQLVASLCSDAEECRLVAIDITEAKQARQTLDLRDRALAEVSQGVIITDENRFIIYANEGFIRLTGYPEEEILGRNCSFLQGPGSSQKTILKIRAALEAKQVFEGEILNYRKNGTSFWNDLLISPIFDPDGGPVRFLGIQRDISDRKKISALFEESQQRLALATESAHMGIWEWDVTGDELICNDQHLQLHGVSNSGTMDSIASWLERLHCDDRPRIEAEIADHLESRADFQTQFRVNLPDGTIRHLRSHGAVRQLDAESATHMIGVTWDVTEECEREKKISAALIREKELSQQARSGEHAKSEFLAVMSHEVRTPVNGILGFAELLANSEGLPPELQNYSRIIAQSSESLLRILDDILNFSRLDTGNIQLETATFAPRVLLNDIRNLFLPQTIEKELDLIVNIDANVPEFLAGDVGRLRQILLNLVGNAMKFTQQGTITIGIKGPSRSQPAYGFSVKDTGPGISAENLEKIFQPFTQADSSVSRRYGGTGLGLTISRRLSEVLGGTLTVRSQPGKGTEFVSTIPFKPADLSSTDAPTTPTLVLDTSFASLHPLKILLVEDDPINLKLIRILVGRLGYDSLTANNGEEAVQVARLEQPDCVLMDLQMPGMDGLEATRAIRRLMHDPPPFIAALTADIFASTSQRCHEAGMDDFLSKPIRIAMLAELFIKASKRNAGMRSKK